MGWGISFGLDQYGRVVCTDGCSWKATPEDYADYPNYPSAREAVLEYFENDAHRELDMIRDECPGTAAALKEACQEHIAYALGVYEEYSDEKKTQLHNEKLAELEQVVSGLKDDIKAAEFKWRIARDEFKDYQKNGNKRKRRAPKTRAEEIVLEMEPFQKELNMEEAALLVDTLRRRKTRAVRDLNMEKKFSL